VKYARLRQASRFLSHVESRFDLKKKMKVEGGLFGKRKGTSRRGKRGQGRVTEGQ
jgi:hypothetical protein